MTAPDFTHPVFTRITHLEIVNPPSWFNYSSLLDGSLPYLTHLAFGDLDAPHTENLVSFFRDALASEDPHLELLIAVSRNEHFLCALELAEINDARFMCLPSYHHPLSPTEYWDGVARGDVQFWRSRDPIVDVVSRT
jgi:hypothetical protein